MNPTKGHHDARHMWWTLFAMCFALFMIMLDNTVVNVALPSIQRGAARRRPSTLEWTVNAYVLTFATLILLGGKLGDRFGRRAAVPRRPDRLHRRVGALRALHHRHAS